MIRVTEAEPVQKSGAPKPMGGVRECVSVEGIGMGSGLIVSCGVLVFRNPAAPEFLLMQHIDRWDLPKGHVDPGETERECALRELHEETGIEAASIVLDRAFRFVHEYAVTPKKNGSGMRQKRLVIFAGWLGQDQPLVLTEHIGYRWIPWSPPHRIQTLTIDPLLAAVAEWNFGRE